MRIESLFPLAIALSGFAASPTEALLLQPSSRNNHHGILTASATPFWRSGSTSTSTALFFKNATRSNFDVDNSPNPLITQGTATTIATTTEEDSSNPSVEDETSEDDLDTNVDLNLDLDFAPFDDNCFPGRDENVRFECDPSVAFWRDFQNNANGQSVPSAQDNVQEMNKIAQMFVRSRASSYFGKHLGRTAYFAVNAVLGDAAYRFVSNRNKSNDKAGAFTQSAKRGPFPMGMSGDYASKLVLEALLCYKQDYFEGIAKGVYREPWDMASLNHRQSNPLNAITQTSRFVRESVGVLGRRSRGTEKDKQVKFFGSNNRSTNNKSGTTAAAAAAAGKAHKSKIYPEYYQTAFHFQGDGEWYKHILILYSFQPKKGILRERARRLCEVEFTHKSFVFPLHDNNCFEICRVDVERFCQRLRDLDRNIVPWTTGFHAAHELATPRRVGQCKIQRQIHE